MVIGEATNTEAGFATLWRRLGSDRRWLVAAHTPPVPDGPTYSRGLAAAMRRADGFIALAEQHWKELTESSRPWFVAPNGVVSSHDLADPAETTVWSGDSPLRLVMLSRIMEHKNPQLLITRSPDLPNRNGNCRYSVTGPTARGSRPRRRSRFAIASTGAVGHLVRLTHWPTATCCACRAG